MITRFVLPGFAALAMLLFLAGCAEEHHEGVISVGVPVGAIEIKSGVGRLAWDAPKYGKVYVVDRDEQTMIYQGPLHAGDHFLVIPEDNRITANGQRLVQRRLKAGHRHTIYFREE